MKHLRVNISNILILCIFIIVLMTTQVFANQVHTIDIQAVIQSDGSMEVTQIWDGFFDEGTEMYIPMNAPDYLTIRELSVSDQNAHYTTVGIWNLDWGFEEKAYKSGIHYTDSGYEICFGISEYGQKRYTISYTLDQVVGHYIDSTGVNFRFVNNQMNTTPTDVTVAIYLADGTPLTEEIADIWGFGFLGEVLFDSGRIVARTTTPISSDNHVTLLLALTQDVISPLRQESGSFEDVKEAAFAGSDYDSAYTEDASFFEVMVVLFIVFALPIGIIILINKLKKKLKAIKRQRFMKKFDYFRDIPNNDNLSVTYTLGNHFDMCEDGSILATGILRLITLGCLTPVQNLEIGFMGKTKEVTSLRLMGSQHHKMNEYDEYLYTILEGAAGADAILQAKELEHFANKNDTLLRAYITKHEKEGKAYLNQLQCLKRWRHSGKLTDLNPIGKQHLAELVGLKRYLEDFSLIAERGINELPIWKELLSYAMLFGIADQVAKQMKELYPTLSSELADYSQSMNTAYSYHYLLYTNMKHAEEQREQEKRSSGSGGSSSWGGGGGSIGGGSGGGSR